MSITTFRALEDFGSEVKRTEKATIVRPMSKTRVREKTLTNNPDKKPTSSDYCYYFVSPKYGNGKIGIFVMKLNTPVTLPPDTCRRTSESMKPSSSSISSTPPVVGDQVEADLLESASNL